MDGNVQVAVDAIAHNPDIIDVTVEGNTIVIKTEIANNGMTFARELTDRGYFVNSITSEQPNLETAFLALTGKKLRD